MQESPPMAQSIGRTIVILSAVALAGCGDDTGGQEVVDATVVDIEDAASIEDASVTPDAPPPIDAKPLPPDASTVGMPCSLPETLSLMLAGGTGGALICVALPLRKR